MAAQLPGYLHRSQCPGLENLKNKLKMFTIKTEGYWYSKKSLKPEPHEMQKKEKVKLFVSHVWLDNTSTNLIQCTYYTTTVLFRIRIIVILGERSVRRRRYIWLRNFTQLVRRFDEWGIMNVRNRITSQDV